MFETDVRFKVIVSCAQANNWFMRQNWLRLIDLCLKLTRKNSRLFDRRFSYTLNQQSIVILIDLVLHHAKFIIFIIEVRVNWFFRAKNHFNVMRWRFEYQRLSVIRADSTNSIKTMALENYKSPRSILRFSFVCTFFWTRARIVTIVIYSSKKTLSFAIDIDCVTLT